MAAERETRADELSEGEAAFIEPTSSSSSFDAGPASDAGAGAPSGTTVATYDSTVEPTSAEPTPTDAARSFGEVDDVTGKVTLPPNPAASGQYDAADKSPEEIEADIRSTRAELSETIDALTQRLSPSYVKEQVKETVKETVLHTTHSATESFRTYGASVGTSLLGTIREHPVPAAIGVVALGYLLTRMRKGGDDSYERYYAGQQSPDYRARADYSGGSSDVDQTYGQDYSYNQQYGAYDASYAQTGADAGYAGADYTNQNDVMVTTYDADAAGDNGGPSMKDRAQDAAADAKAGAQQLGQRAQQAGRRAQSALERQFHQNPLAIGAIAVAAGALVGLALPETQRERELIGPTSDKLKDQAKDLAQEKIDQVKRVADVAVQEVKERGPAIVQGVVDNVKGQAGDVVQQVKEGAQGVLQTTKDEAARQGLTQAPDAQGAADNGQPADAGDQGQTGGGFDGGRGPAL